MGNPKTAKKHPTTPVGFMPGAQLFKLSTHVVYMPPAVSVTAKEAKPQTDLTLFVVLSPGATEVKLFAANDKGYCLSWQTIRAFPKSTTDYEVFRKLGYKLEQ